MTALFVSFCVLLCAGLLSAGSANAQTVSIEGPGGPKLQTLTPRFTVRARGFGDGDGPFQYSVFITRNATGDGPYLEIVQLTSRDTVVSLITSRLLPDTAIVYWKARVLTSNNATVESAISSAREVPTWLRLIYPNSPTGNQDSVRKPTFRWESAPIDPEVGEFIYTVEILDNNRVAEQIKTGVRGNSYVPDNELRANQSYKWRLTAIFPSTGQSITLENLKAFQIQDAALPTTTLLYQNFPNPFPSPISFATCFWFDIQAGGARVSLDILDLRGTLVKSILPPTRLEAGIYGRGPVGASGNCDNRFVWNGTATNGLTVPSGIYLARFSGTGIRTQFKKVVFRGR